jgi:hypothetical protein
MNVPFIHCALCGGALNRREAVFDLLPNSYFCLKVLASTLTQGYETPTLPYLTTKSRQTSETLLSPISVPQISSSKLTNNPPPLPLTNNASPQANSHSPNLRRPLRLRRPPSARSASRRASTSTGERRPTGDAAEDAECESEWGRKAGARSGEEEDAGGEVGDYWGEGLRGLLESIMGLWQSVGLYGGIARPAAAGLAVWHFSLALTRKHEEVAHIHGFEATYDSGI